MLGWATRILFFHSAQWRTISTMCFLITWIPVCLNLPLLLRPQWTTILLHFLIGAHKGLHWIFSNNLNRVLSHFIPNQSNFYFLANCNHFLFTMLCSYCITTRPSKHCHFYHTLFLNMLLLNSQNLSIKHYWSYSCPIED